MSTERIRSMLKSCIDDARKQGWIGDDSDYEHTEEDLEWVTTELKRRPTREEWAAAGLSHVGDAHVDDTQ